MVDIERDNHKIGQMMNRGSFRIAPTEFQVENDAESIGPNCQRMISHEDRMWCEALSSGIGCGLPRGPPALLTKV